MDNDWRPRPNYTPPPPPAPGPSQPSRGWFASAPVSRIAFALNIAVFLAEAAFAYLKLDARGFLAIFGGNSRAGLLFGANYIPTTVGAQHFETLLTSCFLHGGLLHLALNSFVLWQAGPIVERAVGPARMAPMYLACGIGGSGASAIANWLLGNPISSVARRGRSWG